MEYAKRLFLSRTINLGAPFPQKVSYSIHRVSQNAAAALEIGRYLWRQIAHYGVTHLLAPGSGAAPVAAAIGMAALDDGVELETLHVRDPKRARSDERLIEGHLPGGAIRAVFVDDTIMTGETFHRCLKIIAEQAPTIECVAIALVLDSYFPAGTRLLRAQGMPVHAVFNRRELGLTRDSVRKVDTVFSPALWMHAGLVKKPQFERKSIPIVTEKEVITALDDCSVVSYCVENGSVRWRLPSPVMRGKGSSCELLLAPNDILYSGNYSGILTASRQGEILWQYGYCLAFHSRPTLHEGRIYQNAEDYIDGTPRGRLLCIDAGTGELIWEVPHEHYAPTGVVIADDIVIACSNAFLMQAVSLEGKVVWQHKMTALCRGRPLVHENEVIYVDEQGWLVKVALHNGATVARIRFSTSSNHSEPVLVDGVLIVLDNARHMAGYDPSTLRRLWVNRLRGPCQWKPAVHRGYVLTQTTEGGLAATVAKTGEKIWESNNGKRFGCVPPGLSDTHAAIVSLDGRLTFHKLEI